MKSASNCKWVGAVGDTAGTVGRRTSSTGQCSMTPSTTHVVEVGRYRRRSADGRSGRRARVASPTPMGFV